MNEQKKKKSKTSMSDGAKKTITAWVCGGVTGLAIIMYIVALMYVFLG